MSLRKACAELNAEWVAGWIAGRQGFEVPIETIRLWLFDMQPVIRFRVRFDGMTDSFCDLWLRARMTEHNVYPHGSGSISARINLPVELHIGFLFIEETDEMVERLRHDITRLPPTLATPGIERTSQRVHGIDTVARRVAPTELDA